jgi:Uri superfamily endonuclease
LLASLEKGQIISVHHADPHPKFLEREALSASKNPDRDLTPAREMTSMRDQYTALIPASKGTYALILRLNNRQPIQVGKLGAFEFPAGYYLYIGSAFGPGGLAGRLGRHLALNRANSSCHWHIDFLHRQAPIVAIWFSQHEARREHDWATLAGQLPGAVCPAPRFGASDCRCQTHLYQFARLPAAGRFSALLNRAFPGNRPPQIIQIDENYQPVARQTAHEMSSLG